MRMRVSGIKLELICQVKTVRTKGREVFPFPVGVK